MDETMPESSLPVEFLFTLTARLGTPTAIEGGPHGTRRIYPVEGGTFEGPRLHGVIALPSGDWIWFHPDGTSWRLDVRVLLRTHDEASILMTYSGIGTRKDGQISLRTAPFFETGDARYSWLNAIQAVGISRPSERGTVSYDVYALL